jgi:hypothetical protein
MTALEMTALVRLGLQEFWSQALPEDPALIPLLRKEAGAALGESVLSWKLMLDTVAEQWPFAEAPLGRLIHDYQLSLPEAFVLTLVGEVETSHVIDLVLAELQAPARNPRPTVHLCQSIIDALFGAARFNRLDLMRSPLLRDGLISLSGDGPVPLRSLSMPSPLWSILRGDPAVWPGCRLLKEDQSALLPEKIRTQLPNIAAILKNASGILVRGHPNSGRGEFARALGRLLDLEAIEIPADMWRQHRELMIACRYAGWLPVVRPEIGPAEVWRSPEAVRASHPVVIILGTDGAVDAGDILEVELPVPAEAQRAQIWREQLEDEALAGHAASTALLSGPSIVRTAANARLLAERECATLSEKHIAEARRYLSGGRLRLLAQPVVRHVDKDALVVPDLVRDALDNLILRARRRESLWNGMGATLKATPNSGVRALFVGESGTGKTLAASYVATGLNAPLYRVDLSVVMNKYIGESEKNLAQLLDHAAANDVVLLFDEADSLFGSRTEGRDTGERYANMLTNFLLSRIENHPGIVILTTNSRERIDHAFNRRLDLIIDFPLPGYQERLHLWCSHLGDRGPDEAVYRTLASYCDLAGGQVRNVAIAAAARAVGGRINREDLLAGLRTEYQKFGRELPAKIERLLEEGEGSHARISNRTDITG